MSYINIRTVGSVGIIMYNIVYVFALVLLLAVHCVEDSPILDYKI